MILRTTLSVKFTNKTSKQRTIFFQNTLFKSNNFANSYHSYHLTETTSKLTFQDVNICVRHFPQIPQERIDLSREIAEKFGIQFLGAEQLPIQSKSTFIIEVTDQKIRLRETDSGKYFHILNLTTNNSILFQISLMIYFNELFNNKLN